MVSRAIAEGDIQAINYFVAQKYTEALQGIASSPSSKVIMMPLEASSIIGSVAGIAEIAREAVALRTGGGGASRPAPKPKLAPKPVDEPQPSGPWDNA
jgi:hypothetical protein